MQSRNMQSWSYKASKTVVDVVDKLKQAEEEAAQVIQYIDLASLPKNNINNAQGEYDKGNSGMIENANEISDIHNSKALTTKDIVEDY